MFKRHQRPVVLRDVLGGVKPVPAERRAKCVGDMLGEAAEGGVEDRRVLALKQTDRPDLVTE